MMQDWLAASARLTPQKSALLVPKLDSQNEWVVYDYSLLNSVAAYFMLLLATGADIKAGDRIGLLMSNSVEYIAMIHAMARLGAILVPLNIRLTVEELAWQITHTGCKATIVDEYNESNGQALLALGKTVYALPYDAVNPIPMLQEKVDPPEMPFDDGVIDLDALQAIVFTSGTTGKPKGAQITFGNHFWSAVGSSWRIGVLPDDRWLLTLPLYHVGGLSIVFRSALYGTGIVLQDSFDAEQVWHAVETQGVTLVSLVPTMLYRLLEARPGQPLPPSTRLVLLGGAAASPDLINRCKALNIPVATTYGLTEACSQVATMLPEDVRRKLGSVGKPLMFTTVRIADEQGNSLPPREHGEIVVSGPTVMKGYYDETESATLRNGELYTGDIGYMDGEGDLWLLQRRSDLIVSGGENVYPVEVETILRQHPAIAEICVVGVPSEEWGQQVAAAVVLKPDMTVTSEELDAFCRQHLAGYKCPRKYVFVAELPQTTLGKVSRQQVTEMVLETEAKSLE
jgi:O-succinylbenzoic acid--CoA ligase